jgi:predicted negative regulator of RcsB-dependent stress response
MIVLLAKLSKETNLRMPWRRNKWVNLMTRTIIAFLFVLGLAHNAAAQPVADTSVSGWNECLKTATRACVLREAAKAALAGGDPHSSSASLDLGRIAEAQFKAGQSADAAATLDQAIHVTKSLSDHRWRDDGFQTIAAVLARTGRFTEALDIVKRIENRYLYSEACRRHRHRGRAGRQAQQGATARAVC